MPKEAALRTIRDSTACQPRVRLAGMASLAVRSVNLARVMFEGRRGKKKPE